MRQRLTLLAYGGTAMFGYTIGALGPAMPLLRRDLGISRTIGGLHFTALALGALSLGFFTDRLVAHWGRRSIFWLGGAFIAGGALVIGLLFDPALTLVGSVMIGLGGTMLLATSRSSLADIHGADRAVALTESDTAWSLGAFFPPLLIGVAASTWIGWRAALVVPALVSVTAFIALRKEPFPRPNVGRTRSSGRGNSLPKTYWLFWLALIPSGAAEWCMAAWGAGFLVDEIGVSGATASFLMTSFFGAMVLGRLIGSRLARRIDPFTIFVWAISIAAVGAGGFWLTEFAPATVSFLFIGGVGISVLFPMLLSLAVGTAPAQSDKATARVSIAAGIAMTTAPLILGTTADRAGIQTAFAIVPALLVTAALIALEAHRRSATASAAARGSIEPAS